MTPADAYPARAVATTRDGLRSGAADWLWRCAGALLTPLQLGVAFPSFLYSAAMAVFLFKPPDLFAYNVDRIAFGIVVFFVALRAMALRERIPFFAGLSLPMIALTTLAVARVLRDRFDIEVWSVIASKYIVPFALFHVAVLVFRRAEQRKHFEIFVVVVLAYLIFISIAFLADARGFIFPRFILDEGIGFHPDRARGPFLQAVANGVSLNILGVFLAASAARRKFVAGLLWLALPVAILATLTRAVWIAFAFSVVGLVWRMVRRRILVLCALMMVAFIAGGIGLSFSKHSLKDALSDRTAERGPVDARLAVYDAGWVMFKERPLTGWSSGRMYSELARRMEGYHLRRFFVHNTYLALLVEFGMPGLALYAILFVNLFRLSRRRRNEARDLAALRKVWPIVLIVYLINAFFVDMAYQFVNGLLYTAAGMLCASEGVMEWG